LIVNLTRYAKFRYDDWSIKMKLDKKILGAALAFGMAGGGASASTLSPTGGADTCVESNFTFYTQCSGYYDGNDSNQIPGLQGLFGSDWMELAKLDIPDEFLDDAERIPNPAYALTPYSDGILEISGPGESGTWSVSGWGDITQAMAVIKAGNSFSAYLLDMSFTGGDWDTLGVEPVGSGSTPGLSHFTLYKVVNDDPDGDLNVVPLPAGLPLLVAGLGALGVLRMKKRKAA
jgi:hypothetical protein